MSIHYPYIRRLSLIVAAFVVAACAPTTHVHTGAEAPDLPHALVVMGTGEAVGTPDVVRITLGVEAQNVKAQAAVDEANSKMRAVIDSLKKNGVLDKDIRTSQFDIHSEEQPQPYFEAAPMPAPGGKPSGPVAAPAAPRREPIFRVSNTVLLTLRKLDKVGDTLTDAVNSGANRAWGIQFEIDDPKPIVAQARNKAVADARSRAEELARLSGVKLGRVLHVSEMPGSEMPPPMPMMAGYAKAEAAVPIERGQLTIMHTVRIAYAIE